IRPEATGYGCVYFAQEMLAGRGAGIEGKTVTVSGAGNAAQFTAEKALALGARVVTLSDSDGFVHDPDGLDHEKLEWVKELKNVRRGRIREYADKFKKATYHAGKRPWGVPCDLAFPCATQNEIEKADAEELVKNGCVAVSEAANMPSTHEAIELFLHHRLLFAPGKAANAGGVATSGLEMSQNAMHLIWPRKEVDDRLRSIMRSIHAACVEHGREADGFVNYVRGANVAGFTKVAEAMVDQGVV
ncbi:MAG: glutamate dehydrogenase, partial [Candidatus Eremiobacterota bacterium]